MEKDTKTSARPGMADELNSNLYSSLESIAKWIAPCTFKRTERVPLDSKSCFICYEDLMDYIRDPYTTAYPGMAVSVTSNIDDEHEFGSYVLKSFYNDVSGAWELTPDPVGIKTLKIVGLDDAETSTTLDQYGNATVRIESLLSEFAGGSHKHTSTDITDLSDILDGKLDNENPIAYGSLKVSYLQEDPDHPILGKGSLEIGNDTITFLPVAGETAEITKDGITKGENTYLFNPSEDDGIARMKDLKAFITLEELEEGVTFNTLSATSLTVGGKEVSLEGHKHNLWDISGAEEAASTAIDKIQSAENFEQIQGAMIEFLQNFKKPTL